MNEITKSYTAFWPVLLVFLCFTITNLLSLYGNLETRSNLITTVNKLAVEKNKAQAKEAALNGLAHDLLDLAPSSLVAQQIVTDFHIQVKNPPARTSSASTAPATATASANPAPGTNEFKP